MPISGNLLFHTFFSCVTAPVAGTQCCPCLSNFLGMNTLCARVRYMLGPYDLKRLSSYARSIVDHHLIIDLVSATSARTHCLLSTNETGALKSELRQECMRGFCERGDLSEQSAFGFMRKGAAAGAAALHRSAAHPALLSAGGDPPRRRPAGANARARPTDLPCAQAARAR
eukprot:342085-Pleurochrysis_carterae.AAC.1